MHDQHLATTVVVGIDGSQAASAAAVWAVDEAVSRDIPLKLVYVIHDVELLPTRATDHRDDGAEQLAFARAALSEARRAAEAAGQWAPRRLRVETEVLWGNPLAILIELSRSAAMMCVGSVGVEHACHRAGSTAAALAGSANCPVAVIRPPETAQRADTGHIVVEVDASPDNNVVLRWALAEAELRHVPLRVVSSDQPARLNRLIDHWAWRYPDVPVEPVGAIEGIAEYLAEYLAAQAESVRLFVSGTRDRRSLGWPGDTAGCSVLTVGGTH